MRWTLKQPYEGFFVLEMPETYDVSEIEAAFKEMHDTAVAYPGRNILMVVDASRVVSSNIRSRTAIAGCLRKYSHIFGKKVKAQAFVSKRTLVRGAITAIHWLFRPRYELDVFSTYAEAEQWLLSKNRRRATG